jgi:hypothetical protein
MAMKWSGGVCAIMAHIGKRHLGFGNSRSAGLLILGPLSFFTPGGPTKHPGRLPYCRIDPQEATHPSPPPRLVPSWIAPRQVITVGDRQGASQPKPVDGGGTGERPHAGT